MAAKPTVWRPLDKVVITQSWGENPDFYRQYGQKGHNGEDQGHNPIGTPVYAMDEGTIEFEGWGRHHSWMGDPAGICVLVRHWWGFSGYAHLDETIVDRGQRVARGQQIGTVGTTGASTGPHLHSETFPLSPNFGNGFAGRVNPASIVNIIARGSADTPSAGGGTEVKRKYFEDTKSKVSGREIKPGEYIYLAELSNPKVSNFKNVTPQGAGNYSITPTVRIDGEPGDEVEVVFVSINGAKQSTHFPESIVIGPQGTVIRTVNFDWELGSGWEGAIRVTALRSNKKPVTTRRIYCATSLFA